MILSRDHTLRSTAGRSIEFLKGADTWVPPMLVREAVAIGAVPSDGSDANVLEEPKTSKLSTDPAVRKEAILVAFANIQGANHREDFTAAGAPHPDAIRRETGYKIDNKELNVLWHAYQDEQGSQGKR
jgi:hypothetical protein